MPIETQIWRIDGGLAGREQSTWTSQREVERLRTDPHPFGAPGLPPRPRAPQCLGLRSAPTP